MGDGGWDGGFFLAARILGEGSANHSCLLSLSLCLSLSLSLSPSFKGRSARALFTPGSVHSGSTSLEDYGRVLPDEMRVSSFPDRLPRSARTAA